MCYMIGFNKRVGDIIKSKRAIHFDDMCIKEGAYGIIKSIYKPTFSNGYFMDVETLDGVLLCNQTSVEWEVYTWDTYSWDDVQKRTGGTI